jgi:transcription-repair coupling factor (superfamily II helicase)
MNSIRIKWIASRLGIEILVMKQGKMIGYFVRSATDYYKSNRFTAVMHFVQKTILICKIKKRPRTACDVVDFDNKA